MAVAPAFQHRRRGNLPVHQLHPRQQSGGAGNGSLGGNAATIGIVAAVVLLITACLVLYTLLRRWKVQGKSPRYIPTQFLKRRWQTWVPGGKYSAVRNRDLASANTAYTGSNINGSAAEAGVDRNTSVRSVITLPAYSRTPKESEQVIGREGERSGMDTVVEFPETQQQEEERREEQMESLYQIRVARRREMADREERRRERREARERGDTARLQELRRQSQQRANESTASLNSGLGISAATLIAEHQSRGRETRTSSVAYGSLGEVRHDGTRIRANSNDSERGGLLNGAAPMGEVEGRSRGYSDATSVSNLQRLHTRDHSISNMSISTVRSEIDPHAPPGSTAVDDRPRPRSSHSDEQQSGTSNSSPTANRFTPDESTGSEDMGDSHPAQTDLDEANRPPEYDYSEWGDAPAYEAAIARRAASNAGAQPAGGPIRIPSSAPQLPQLDLPSISVSDATEPNTPVTPQTNTNSNSSGGHDHA